MTVPQPAPADQSLAAANEPPAAGQSLPNVLVLSRRVLTLSLIAVTLIPVSVATTVWLAIPSTPEPRLPVTLTLEPVPWPPGSESVKLMPGVHLHNPTDQGWTNVSLAINKRFYFYSPDPLPAGSHFRVPLNLFKTSGNQPYRPAIVPMTLITVYAQLPNGQRAILDVKY